MNKIAIIGAGISGLTSANLLKDRYDIVLYEKSEVPGGLIKCNWVNGGLFHTCGGHVFNSKRKDVLDWFKSKFFLEQEFLREERNSTIYFDNGAYIPYPLEDHIYYLNPTIQKQIIDDYIELIISDKPAPQNFEDFLKANFGKTLYSIYFKPYNEKVWRRNLKTVPLRWLEGKLPTPSIKEMIYNNINHVEEKKFVHSTYWYPKNNGSQFIANRLAENLRICYNNEINEIKYDGIGWRINETPYEKIIFCGNIKEMANIIKGINITNYLPYIDDLEYHGTTSVFCELDKTPYSWIYQPSILHKSHRIICTGNFSEHNHPFGKTNGTIEFTDKLSIEEIKYNLQKMPLHPKYLAHCYNKFTYPIQDLKTRQFIRDLKLLFEPYGLYFTGRFADWEYYNMDVAIGAAIDLCKKL